MNPGPLGGKVPGWRNLLLVQKGTKAASSPMETMMNSAKKVAQG